jgi:uncharacterized protein
METDLLVRTDAPLDEEFALERIRRYRSAIEEYINYKDRRFLTALKPLSVELTAPAIVREMARQAAKANVGPMASVAGAIAQFLGKSLLKKGYADVVIENGGDLFLKTRKPVRVGIYAGRSRFSRRLSLCIAPGQMPAGIASSSGTVGHSLSFGSADCVTIIARSAVLADACATAAANRITAKKDLAGAIAFARSIPGVAGALIIFRNTLASWGAVTLS